MRQPNRSKMDMGSFATMLRKAAAQAGLIQADQLGRHDPDGGGYVGMDETPPNLTDLARFQKAILNGEQKYSPGIEATFGERVTPASAADLHNSQAVFLQGYFNHRNR
jgi:hypothetical protein